MVAKDESAPKGAKKPESAPRKEVPSTPAQPPVKNSNAGKFVKHNPMELFSARRISRADWATLGIDQGDAEWNEQNHFRIPAGSFSKDALNYLLNQDDGFELV